MQVWISHEEGVGLLGPLPDGVKVHVGNWPGPEVRFWVPPFLKVAPDPAALAGLRQLAVVQLLSAGAEAWLGRLAPPVTLCDARGVHSSSTSEWVLTAILAYLRDFPFFVRAQERADWAYRATNELAGKHVLIVGAGAIGEAIAARLAPFDVTVSRVARRARTGVHAVSELPGLLPEADVVVLIVPLTTATTGMVDAAFLSRMRDGALLVNAARGPVVQTDALTAELATGRIGAAADVTDPEPLPPAHPLWTMPNFLLTPHVAGSVVGLLPRAYGLAGDQIRRYAAGQPVINAVTDGY